MFLKVGHRGARAYEIENTIESFRKAIELGANAVELDVRRSKDKELILSHDDNLKKVYGEDLYIKDATLRRLKELTGGKICTLREALSFIDKKVDKILVELKEPECEKDVLEVVTKEGLLGRAIIVSFNEEYLINIRKLNSEIETGLVYAKYKNPIEAALNLKAQYLLPLYRLLHTKDIEKAHKNNLRVITWTINSKKEAINYISKGVDGIATDRPDILKDT